MLTVLCVYTVIQVILDETIDHEFVLSMQDLIINFNDATVDHFSFMTITYNMGATAKTIKLCTSSCVKQYMIVIPTTN